MDPSHLCMFSPFTLPRNLDRCLYAVLTSRHGTTYQLGEHDDASDSDGERGDARAPPGPMPQDHSDLRRMRVAERRREAQVRCLCEAMSPWKDSKIDRNRQTERQVDRQTGRHVDR